MAEEKQYMPSGMGGLVRFGEEEEPIVKVKPKQLIYIVAGIAAIEIAARYIFI